MSNQIEENSANRNEIDPMPIRIVVSYEWEKQYFEEDGRSEVRPLRQHRRWAAIKDLLQGAIDNAKSRSDKIPGKTQFQVEIVRLRGRHGMALLPNLMNRISVADIIVVDLGTENEKLGINTNVILELGMALQAGKSNDGSLFVLKPHSFSWPSDLQGFLCSEYQLSKSPQYKFKMNDRTGFDAALRAKIIEIAKLRGMLGRRNEKQIEYEDDKYNKIEII